VTYLPFSTASEARASLRFFPFAERLLALAPFRAMRTSLLSRAKRVSKRRLRRCQIRELATWSRMQIPDVVISKQPHCRDTASYRVGASSPVACSIPSLTDLSAIDYYIVIVGLTINPNRPERKRLETHKHLRWAKSSLKQCADERGHNSPLRVFVRWHPGRRTHQRRLCFRSGGVTRPAVADASPPYPPKYRIPDNTLNKPQKVPLCE